MTGGALNRVSIASLLTTVGLLLIGGCGSDASDNSKPATCFDIKSFTVLHVAPLHQEKKICRLELNPPPGFQFVDKTGERLPYHPYVLVKPN